MSVPVLVIGKILVLALIVFAGRFVLVRIAGFGFTNLEDDLGFFPTYNPSAVIRQEVLDADPHIGEVLNSMAASLCPNQSRASGTQHTLGSV